MNSITPIFRIFEEAKAREFYIDWLSFKIDFEHRFEENTPIYIGISKGDICIHLSEHHGDGTPASKVLVLYNEVEKFCQELEDKKYKYYRPSIETTFWESMCMEVCDPFGNKLLFYKKV